MAMSPAPYLVTQIDGERLWVGPAASVTPAMAAFIRKHKAELLRELRTIEQEMGETKNDTPIPNNDTRRAKSDTQNPWKLPKNTKMHEE
jgi:hypothetical protein